VKMRDKCVWPDGRFCCVCKAGHKAFYSQQNPDACSASSEYPGHTHDGAAGIRCAEPIVARIIPFRPLGNVK
jgi:hypothetical protein